MIDDKETFILYVYATSCHNCTSFAPKLESVANEYKIQVYKIDVDKFSGNESINFKDKINFKGATPTLLIIRNGDKDLEPLDNRIVGDVDKERIINYFKVNGYIK